MPHKGTKPYVAAALASLGSAHSAAALKDSKGKHKKPKKKGKK